MTRPYAVKTKPTPAAVPPAVPVSPFAPQPVFPAPSPFAARAPFADRSPFAATSPFAQTQASPFAEPSPFAAKTPWASKPKRYGRQLRIVQHHIVIPTGRRRPRQSGSRWVLAVEEMERIFEQDAKTFTSGDGWNFTELATYAGEQDHANDYCPYTQDNDAPGDTEAACPHPLCAEHVDEGHPVWESGMQLDYQLERNAACADLWPELRPMLIERRDQVLADPERFLRDSSTLYSMKAVSVLEDADVELGPADFGGLGHTSTALSEQVLARLHLPQVRDALADAILRADCERWAWTVYQDKGDDLPSTDYEKLLCEAVSRGNELELVPGSWMQYLVFPRLRGESDAIEGHHLVTGASYHSFLTEPHSEVGLLGWREVVMEPCDEDWNQT